MNILFIFTFFFCLLICKSLGVYDKVCASQKEIIGDAFKRKDPISKVVFNDTKSSVLVTWIGENTGKIIIVSAKEISSFITIVHPSDVYFSENNGKNFTKITNRLPVQTPYIKRNNGLQRNMYNSTNIFLVCYSAKKTASTLIITNDGGGTWRKFDIDFILDKEITFHPTNQNWLLTLSRDNSLFRSLDGGQTWKKVLSNVYGYQWSTKSPGDIFAKVSDIAGPTTFLEILLRPLMHASFSLQKSSDNGDTWTILKSKTYGFIMRDKFLFVSILVENNRRRLLVSTDEGKTFNKVYLPMIENHQFYSILHIENDLVFLHVDNPDDNGDGILYTSDSDGRIFTPSLMNHFYPNQRIMSDFYKIKSMRGTYIASQLQKDKSLRSLITFDRGAEWKSIKKPADIACSNEKENTCTLQVTGEISQMNRVSSYPPESTPTAIGVVLAHGFLANSLKRTDADVFVTSDGGYNWNKALDGPHRYAIADHGGLLIAIGRNATILKFSTDEGRCWHEHQFTTDDIEVTGLLTEPGNKAMTVAIWSFRNSDKNWIIHVVDLSELLNRQCNDDDYEDWYSHSEMPHSAGAEYSGCFLGKKEKFLRLKKDSLCKNGYSHEVKKVEESCPCTEDDYECDFGYNRPVNSKKCQISDLMKQSICKSDEKPVKIDIPKKIPADDCKGGFVPKSNGIKQISDICGTAVVSSVTKKPQTAIQTAKFSKPNYSSTVRSNINFAHQIDRNGGSTFRTFGIIMGSILAILCFGFVVFLVASRWRIIRQKHSNLRYRILSGLSGNQTSADDDDAALIINENNYESTSPSKRGKARDDSDVELIN